VEARQVILNGRGVPVIGQFLVQGQGGAVALLRLGRTVQLLRHQPERGQRVRRDQVQAARPRQVEGGRELIVGRAEPPGILERDPQIYPRADNGVIVAARPRELKRRLVTRDRGLDIAQLDLDPAERLQDCPKVLLAVCRCAEKIARPEQDVPCLLAVAGGVECQAEVVQDHSEHDEFSGSLGLLGRPPVEPDRSVNPPLVPGPLSRQRGSPPPLHDHP